MNTTRAWRRACGAGLAAMLLVPGAALADDTTPPAVTLAAGCDGRTLSEYVGPITGTASDDSGTVTVRVDVDGATIFGPATQPSGGFSFSWDTRQTTNGPHTMTVVASDAAGHETSFPCPWTVSNSALTVPFTAPADEADVSGNVTLAFEPRADGSPVSAPVRIKVDGVEIGSDVFPPYQLDWDTTQVADGPHTVTAEMFWRDYPDPQATSTIHVNVANLPGPVAAYGFQESSGSAVVDSTGNGRTGTIAGGAARTASGRYGRGLTFDGVNDLVTVPDADPLDLTVGMTLEAWVKPTALSGYRTVVLKERPAGLAYALYASRDTTPPSANITTDVEHASPSTSALPLNVWSHVAATYDGTHLDLYVNGSLVASHAVSGSVFTSARALVIGGNRIWSEWFKGSIDEVRVYDRALSALEIQADRDTPVVAGV